MTAFRVIWVIVLLAYLVLWVRALAQITRTTADDLYRSGNQILWAAVVLLVPVLGLIAYHVAGSPRRARA